MQINLVFNRIILNMKKWTLLPFSNQMQCVCVCVNNSVQPISASILLWKFDASKRKWWLYHRALHASLSPNRYIISFQLSNGSAIVSAVTHTVKVGPHPGSKAIQCRGCHVGNHPLIGGIPLSHPHMLTLASVSWWSKKKGKHPRCVSVWNTSCALFSNGRKERKRRVERN